jgi:hypothetical protein
MNSKQKTKWWIDTALFTGYISTFFLDLTGVDMHQWIGLVCGLVTGYHLLTHWTWISAVIQRLFGKTSDQARLYLLIDTALLGGFFTITLTGLLISTWLNLNLASYEIWRVLHITASIGTLLVVCIKIGLHWRWIYSMAKNIFIPEEQKLSPSRYNQSALRPETKKRRDFLRVMGVVGLTSILALGKSIQSLQVHSLTEREISKTSTTQASRTGNSSSTGTCSIRCGRKCTYPGKCRRYVDTNSNKRCDLGECI